MNRVTVTALIAHDAYIPGETYPVDADRAQRLASAGLIRPVDTVKGGRRGARKTRPGGSEPDDQGSIAPGAGDSGTSGDEQG